MVYCQSGRRVSKNKNMALYDAALSHMIVLI